MCLRAHVIYRVGKPLQKYAKGLCSVHVHTGVADYSVWKIPNFAEFVYIVFVKPLLHRCLHSLYVKIEFFVALIWNIFGELTSYKSKHSVALIILKAKERRIESLTFGMI